ALVADRARGGGSRAAVWQIAVDIPQRVDETHQRWQRTVLLLPRVRRGQLASCLGARHAARPAVHAGEVRPDNREETAWLEQLLTPGTWAAARIRRCGATRTFTTPP